jgi:hypothetical protein
LPSANLSTEVEAKIGSELTDAVQQTLAVKRSYQIQKSRQITQSVKYTRPKPSEPGKPIHLTFYPQLWLWSWEFYLYRVEHLSFRYHRNLLRQQVREPLSNAEDRTERPLFCVRFYEPQEDQLSLAEGDFDPDVAEAGEITIEPLPAGILPKNPCRLKSSLQQLAESAFPTSEDHWILGFIEPKSRKGTPKRAAAKKKPPARTRRSSTTSKSKVQKAREKKAGSPRPVKNSSSRGNIKKQPKIRTKTKAKRR